MEGQSQDSPLRKRIGRTVIGVGIVLIVLATLHLADAGYGSSVNRGFAHRRSYDMVKRDARRAFPETLLLALGGLGLILAGGRILRGPAQLPGSGEG